MGNFCGISFLKKNKMNFETLTISDFLGIIFAFGILIYLTLTIFDGLTIFREEFGEGLKRFFHYHYHYRDRR